MDGLSSKENGSYMTTAITSISSSEQRRRAWYEVVTDDDDSFNSIQVNHGYNNPPYGTRKHEPIRSKTCSNASPIWPESSPPGRQLSYSDELQYLPQQHVFAPPGKIGVAIDVDNGQPIVYKVRNGSPLEKMLQRNDVIVAIDDEDTSCLSAADVTEMMVKRIDRVRKITFVRRKSELIDI